MIRPMSVQNEPWYSRLTGRSVPVERGASVVSWGPEGTRKLLRVRHNKRWYDTGRKLGHQSAVRPASPAIDPVVLLVKLA